MQKYIVKKETAEGAVGYFDAFDDLFMAEVGDLGFYLVNNDFERHSGFKTYFTEREDFDEVTEVNICNFFGVKVRGKAYCAIVTGMPYAYQVHLKKSGNTYSIGLRYDLEFYSITEDVELQVYELPDDADWFEMAKCYRKYQLETGHADLLKDRLAGNDVLQYTKDSLEIRIRMGWKPSPPEILEQTPENEPEMQVACTFDTVKKIVAELKAQGVEKAEICLVGWNKSGHDGRWPTAFPVEPKLGGEEKLLELIAYAKENGYNIVGHTNALDCYSISNEWNNGEITIKTKEGLPRKNSRGWSGGMMYWTCPKRALEIAHKMYSDMDHLGFRGSAYSDVLSIVRPRQCFDENHPCTVRETVEKWGEIMKVSKEHFGGFASEGVFDHCVKDLDYGLYVRFNRKRLPYMDEGLPVWEAVYHDIIMGNPGNNTINYNCGDADTRLQMVEMSGRPCFYYYTAFMKVTTWGSQKSRSVFVANTDEDIKETVYYIKDAYDEYTSYKDLLTEEITGYCQLYGEDVTETTYADGTKVIVNYLNSKFTYGDKTIKPKDYLILRPKKATTKKTKKRA